MDQEVLRKLILEAISDVLKTPAESTNAPEKKSAAQSAPPFLRVDGAVETDEGCAADLSAIDYRTVISVPHPLHPEQFREWRAKSAARIGIWRAGPRYRTESYLRFRADHAAAMDAVSKDVPRELLERMHLFSVSTVCENKDEYLTRPDRGRMFSVQTMDEIKRGCKMAPDVQIVVADGLSSAAKVRALDRRR